jgi:PEP-CTERM motif
VDNRLEGPDQPFPYWHISWEENSSAIGKYSTDGGAPDNPNGPGYEFPVVELTVPEPSAWAMMFIGFAGLGFAAHRRQRRKAELPAA